MDKRYLSADGDATTRCHAKGRRGFAYRLAQTKRRAPTDIGRICCDGREMVAIPFRRRTSFVALLSFREKE